MSAQIAPAETTRVRFAPSPTGAVHLGSALVALANVAFARASGGSFVLRIDDTDAARSDPDDIAGIERCLRWLELDWDEGPIRQSERSSYYDAALRTLVDRDAAYPCFCTTERLAELRAQQIAAHEPPRYDGRCRNLPPETVRASLDSAAPHVLRLRVDPAADVSFLDLVRGQVTVPAGSFGDPVLRRADGSAGYLLASAVDDLLLRITHIVRGEDHLTNTARQLLILAALDSAYQPQFAHLPLLRDEHGAKLSKRDPMGTLDELVSDGFLPVTVRRYLAELIGQGAIDLLDPAATFDLARVPIGAPKVDRGRLESIGRDDVAALDPAGVLARVQAADTEPRRVLTRELAAESPTTTALHSSLTRLLDGPSQSDLPALLAPVTATVDDARTTYDALSLAVREFRREPTSAGDEVIAAVRAAGKELGMRPPQLLKPIRLALTGSLGGPHLGLIVDAIGMSDACGRVQRARVAIEHAVGGNVAGRG